MPKSVHITTPWPTFEEEAQRLGVPKIRRNALRKLADTFLETKLATVSEKAERKTSNGTVRREKYKNGAAAD